MDIPHLDGASVVFDGVLEEPVWQRAADTGLFVDPTSGGAPPPHGVRGSARVFWDDAHIYVGYSVVDVDVRGGFPPNSVDPHLWERDTVELMLDPDGDGDNRDYYEIQIGPQNLVFDSQFDDYNLPKGGPRGPFGHQDWSARLVSAVRIDGTIDDDRDSDAGYVVEAKIPFSSLTKAAHTPPRPGDEWRVNLYAMKNNGGVAWSPILGRGNFHRASRFGRWVFRGD
ncbi:MAG: carbohydrate-binding family 9-like protein [Polyangiaceae bacterium]